LKLGTGEVSMTAKGDGTFIATIPAQGVGTGTLQAVFANRGSAGRRSRDHARRVVPLTSRSPPIDFGA
jgi:hypothetical protein